MTKKAMRVKDVGATINLGNYSSLHITIGEPSEFEGLDLGKAEKYLRTVAKSVNGVLNLPEEKPKKKAAKKENPPAPSGVQSYAFGTTTPVYYDHATHCYTSAEGVHYDSVTQMLERFYPFGAKGVIKEEYLDFASSFGNLIHTAIQNSVIGMKPSKKLVSGIVDSVLEAMGPYEKAYVEQLLAYPKEELAGRFDILTQAEDGEVTLWDVKTNSDIYAKANCGLPDSLKEQFGEYWAVDTIFGEHCLQLNTYAYMLEQTTDYKVDKIKIIYVPDEFKKIIDVQKVDISPLFQAYGAIR